MLERLALFYTLAPAACGRAETSLIEKLLEVRPRLTEADLGEGIGTPLRGAA